MRERFLEICRKGRISAKIERDLHERMIYASDVHTQAEVNVRDVKFPQCETVAVCDPHVIANQRVSRATIISVIIYLSLRHPFSRRNLKVEPHCASDRRDGQARVFSPRLKT